MGLFSSFRTNSSSSVVEDEVQRMEATEQQQSRAVEKAHEREAKQLLKERKKQQKAILKQRKKEQDAINKQMKKQQDAVKHAQKKEQQQLEKEQKKVVKERQQTEKRLKQAEKERKRAIKKELNAVKALAKQTRKESKKKEREAKKQVYRLRYVQKKQERARKRVLKKQLKEEKKRLQQQVRYATENERLASELEHHSMELAQSTVVAPSVEEPLTTMPKTAPVFKNRLNCASCCQKFMKFPTRSRHHCRQCGNSFCSHCLSTSRRAMPWIQLYTPQRICVRCDGVLLRTNLEPKKEELTIPQRSLSLSEQPVSESIVEDEKEPIPPSTSSSFSSSRRVIRLRSHSRSSSFKSGKKNSLWNLPIRPLLKRKESIDQLRNRTWDLNLQIEKAQQVAKMNNHTRVLDMTLQSVLATAS